FIFDLRSSIFDLRSSILDPRSSTLDPHLLSAPAFIEPSASEMKKGKLPKGECDSNKTPRSLMMVAPEAKGNRSSGATFDGGLSGSEAAQRAIVASISPHSSFTELKLLTAAGRAIFFAAANWGEALRLRPS